MRILFVAPESPFARDQGTTLRTRGLARELGRRHDVTVLGLGEATAGTPGWVRAHVVAPRARRSSISRLGDLLLGRADLAGRARSSALLAALSGLARTGRFDAVFLEGLEMSYCLDELAGFDEAPLVVYDAHNAEHLLQRRAWESDRRRLRALPAALYSWVQWRRLRELEASVGRRADLVVCTSEPDRAALAALAPGLEPILVPNGVDLEEIAHGAPRARIPDTVVFAGKMDYRPNRDAAQWFARDVFPRVRAARPGARFLVVGRDPTPGVRALGRLPGVSVTGPVEDARRYLGEASVAVAPLRMGSGTRIKILEAMALGTPNVATRLGAEGLDVEPGRDILLADGVDELARSVLALLEDPERARAVGLAGRARVAERYDWRRLVASLEGALEARR